MILLQRRPGLAIRGYSYPYDEVGIYPPRSRGPDLREKRLGNRPITANLAAVIAVRDIAVTALADARISSSFFFIRALESTVSAPKDIFD